MLQTVDIRRTFLNAQFTSDDKPIYLRIHGFFKIHKQLLTLQNKDNCYSSLQPINAGYEKSINDECQFYKNKG